MTTPTKTRKSANTKARDALSVAERKVASLESRLVKLRLTVTILMDELNVAVAEREYLAKNPALVDKADPVDPSANEEKSTRIDGS